MTCARSLSENFFTPPWNSTAPPPKMGQQCGCWLYFSITLFYFKRLLLISHLNLFKQNTLLKPNENSLVDGPFMLPFWDQNLFFKTKILITFHNALYLSSLLWNLSRGIDGMVSAHRSIKLLSYVTPYRKYSGIIIYHNFFNMMIHSLILWYMETLWELFDTAWL
jgi:hypothetical protein